MPSLLVLVCNIGAIGAIVAWRAHKLGRPGAIAIIAGTVLLPFIAHAISLSALVLPVAAAFWVTGLGRLLYQGWRKYREATKGPPTGPKRMHLNKDWSPKRSYDSLAEAQAVAHRQGTQEGRVLDAYKCKICKKFHVGHEHQ